MPIIVSLTDEQDLNLTSNLTTWPQVVTFFFLSVTLRCAFLRHRYKCYSFPVAVSQLELLRKGELALLGKPVQVKYRERRVRAILRA